MQLPFSISVVTDIEVHIDTETHTHKWRRNKRLSFVWHGKWGDGRISPVDQSDVDFATEIGENWFTYEDTENNGTTHPS